MLCTENQWMDAVDEAVESYVSGELDFEEAHERLVRIGLDAHEAQTLLTEAMK